MGTNRQRRIRSSITLSWFRWLRVWWFVMAVVVVELRKETMLSPSTCWSKHGRSTGSRNMSNCPFRAALDHVAWTMYLSWWMGRSAFGSVNCQQQATMNHLFHGQNQLLRMEKWQHYLMHWNFISSCLRPTKVSVDNLNDYRLGLIGYGGLLCLLISNHSFQVAYVWCILHMRCLWREGFGRVTGQEKMDHGFQAQKAPFFSCWWSFSSLYSVLSSSSKVWMYCKIIGMS